MFGKEFAFLNRWYLAMTMLVGLLWLAVNVALFAVFVLIPAMLLFACDLLMVCWLCRGQKRPTSWNPFVFLRRLMGDERLYLSTRSPMERGFLWRIRDHVQVQTLSLCQQLSFDGVPFVFCCDFE